MKSGCIYFASFFFFQIAFSQGNYRSSEPVKRVELVAKINKAEAAHIYNAKAFVKTNNPGLSIEKIIPAILFPNKQSPEVAFPLVSAVLAIPFIHVPGFIIGFPIPVASLFNQQKVMATGVPIKMSAGIIRRNEIGLIMNF